VLKSIDQQFRKQALQGTLFVLPGGFEPLWHIGKI